MREISHNQREVGILLLEFLKNRHNIKPQQRNIFGTSGFFHQTTLVSIGKKFLLPLNRDDDQEIELKKLIEKDFFNDGGIKRFENYRQTLQLEKRNGFQNLALLFLNLQKKQQNLN
ncbi:MAG: hypothetical protein JST_000538 [Candidatus Parcubacteria bacterium]|jgi:hypothetical protein